MIHDLCNIFPETDLDVFHQANIINKNKHPLSLIFENAFRELLKDKSITEQSEIKHFQRKIERYI